MSHAADPWPDADPVETDTGDATLTVSQVGQRLQGAVTSAFPGRFWMVGEASGLSRTAAKAGRAGHWYFQLADPDVDDPRRRPAVEVKCWRGTIDRLFGSRGKLRDLIQPEDGIVLRVRCQADYYAPRGQVSFTIEDVDPSYTLGALDRERRELLARLEAEGTLQLNPSRPLTDVPLELGLVTSAGSAAHHDVMDTLTASGLGFRIRFCDARTQGPGTGPSVCAALASLGAMRLDAILLVRGGGSRLDLSWFDKEDVARAIAACPLPVLTGIGHEIDTSVADAVAHTAFKTPTAVAEFVVACARACRDEVEQTALRLAQHGADTLHDHDLSLTGAARALVLLAREGLGSAAAHLASAGHQLSERTGACLAAAAEHLAAAHARLASGAPLERMSRLEAALESDGRRLLERALASLEQQEQLLLAAELQTRLLDPRSVLARGYVLLRRADGRVLMDAAAVHAGERLTAVLRDGELPLRHAPDNAAPASE